MHPITKDPIFRTFCIYQRIRFSRLSFSHEFQTKLMNKSPIFGYKRLQLCWWLHILHARYQMPCWKYSKDMKDFYDLKFLRE